MNRIEWMIESNESWSHNRDRMNPWSGMGRMTAACGAIGKPLTRSRRAVSFWYCSRMISTCALTCYLYLWCYLHDVNENKCVHAYVCSRNTCLCGNALAVQTVIGGWVRHKHSSLLLKKGYENYEGVISEYVTMLTMKLCTNYLP